MKLIYESQIFQYFKPFIELTETIRGEGGFGSTGKGKED